MNMCDICGDDGIRGRHGLYFARDMDLCKSCAGELDRKAEEIDKRHADKSRDECQDALNHMIRRFRPVKNARLKEKINDPDGPQYEVADDGTVTIS